VPAVRGDIDDTTGLARSAAPRRARGTKQELIQRFADERNGRFAGRPERNLVDPVLAMDGQLCNAALIVNA
jgi:hypothetical protein